MDRIVNGLIIIKTFPIQQVGTCNGGSETGKIDHFLPIWHIASMKQNWLT